MRTSLVIGSVLPAALLMLASALTLSACAADASEIDDATDGEEANVASTQEAIYSGWTPYTSEENPPIICDNASLMSAVQFSGRYSDNVRAYCSPTSGTLGSSYWTSYFSEEGTNYRFCDWGYWVTGLSCTGGYCDNVALQCSYIGNVTATSCYWTGWMSEENGGYLGFGAGYYMRGAQCSGSNCDNMRFYVCRG